MLVRYFAAALDAAGTESETISLPAPGTVADFQASVAAAHPALASVLPQCTLLVDGAAATAPDQDITSAATVDVLPPFAGG